MMTLEEKYELGYQLRLLSGTIDNILKMWKKEYNEEPNDMSFGRILAYQSAQQAIEDFRKNLIEKKLL